MATITISGMQFYGYHGCFEEEQTIGTRFVVDLALTCDASRAAATDSIEDAVDYVAVYKVVEKVMSEPTHLLETLADRIIQSVRQAFPSISQIRVKVCKLNPPLDVKTDFVSVEMDYSVNE